CDSCTDAPTTATRPPGRSSLAPQPLVLEFRGELGRSPPGLVLAVPVDGCSESVAEARVPRRPTQLITQLGRVDRIAEVVAGAVADVLEVVRILAHELEDGAHHGEVVDLAVSTNEIGLADAPRVDDAPHRGGVV